MGHTRMYGLWWANMPSKWPRWGLSSKRRYKRQRTVEGFLFSAKPSFGWEHFPNQYAFNDWINLSISSRI